MGEMNMHYLSLILLVASSISWALPLEGLKDLDGNPAKFEHEKKYELVLFWATWCPECKVKLKEVLPKLSEHAEVAAVTINTEKDVDRVKHFLSKENIKMPVFMDPDRKLRAPLKVFSVPHWAVYSRNTQSKRWDLVDSAPAFEKERIQKALGGISL
jgi:thiol-disulfide isomerase/thioredoxin